MYCKNRMLCIGDCPKIFKSLTYNHLKINSFEFLKYFFLSSVVRYVQIVINETFMKRIKMIIIMIYS